MNLTTIVEQVPELILANAISDVTSIDWNNEDILDFEVEKTDESFVLRMNQIDLDSNLTSVEEFDASSSKLPMTLDIKNVQVLIDWLKSITNSSFVGSTRIVSLFPGAYIPNHTNNNNYFSYYTRYHIPLVTHSDVKFINTVTGVEDHMSVGNVYKLSNDVEHQVINNSDIFRIHLIVDLA